MKKHAFTYNPFEFAISGPSGSGKTTLACSLTQRFSEKRKSAFVKHSKDRFELDHEGKDTFRAKQSGAAVVSIESPSLSARVMNQPEIPMPVRQDLLDADLVIVESFKSLDMPKIVVIDEEKKMIQPILKQEYENVIACVGPWETSPNPDLPYYLHRNDTHRIFDRVQLELRRITERTPLYGLVLAGGASRRMGRDKAALNIHGSAQSEHLFGLLSKVCGKVFLSNRTDQKDAPGHENLPQIHDLILNAGPMGGILSALKTHPDAAWLVVACDLPHLNLKTLFSLSHARNPYKMATCFKSAFHEGSPEPLCAIYEPKSVYRLAAFWASGQICPRHILKDSDIELVDPVDEQALENMNRPGDYEAAIKLKT